MEVYGQETVADLDLADLIPSGNLVDESGCGISSFWGCTVNYSFQLRVTDAEYGSSDLSFSTENDGLLHAHFSLNNITLDWEADAAALIEASSSGTVTSSSASVHATLRPYVDNNQIKVDLTSTSSSFDSLDFNVNNNLLNTVINGLNLDSLIESELESTAQDAIQDAIENELPDLLAEILGVLEDFSISESFDVQGDLYSFTARPSEITVEDNGLVLSMQAQIQSDGWVLTNSGLGSIKSSQAPAPWSNSTGIGIDLSLNVINQLLYQTWGSEMLYIQMGNDELGIGTEDLSFIFPNSTDLQLTIDGLLPPTVVEKNGSLELQLGDIYVALHNGPLASNDVRLEVYAHATAPLTLDIDANGSTVTPTIGDMDFTFDLVYPSTSDSSAQSTEILLGLLVPELVPNLTESLSGIELPTLDEFSFGGISSEISNNHFGLRASLQAN